MVKSLAYLSTTTPFTLCKYWMIVTMLHWLIKELIKGHPSDAAELIKSFMSWLQNNALIKMVSCQDALSWIHYRTTQRNCNDRNSVFSIFWYFDIAHKNSVY